VHLHLAGVVHAGCAEAILELAGVDGMELGHLSVQLNARYWIICALVHAIASFWQGMS
jgi:hypothetical protein